MFKKILIANRGEIAIRIARTAAEMGVATVAVFPEDDAQSLHVKAADEAWPLEGAGAGAYLDGAQIVAAAKACACEAIHPGYGFLSENAAFARMCEDAGVAFIGPGPEALELFGDKTAARRLAIRCGIPVLAGSHGPVTKVEAKAFFAELGDGGAVMLKAVAGGGGRGMRAVTRAGDLDAAFDRSSSEALKAFGSGDVYVERLMPNARHVEAQILGDGAEAVHLWDRECSLQRQRQKLVETAPALSVAEDVREELLEAATRLAQAAHYRGLGTIEFLVDAGRHEAAEFVFIEANPRLQVEHTVTEEVTGLDLVRLQLEIAAGRTLHDLGLAQAQVPAPRGVAIQARVNLETMGKDGAARPTGGTLSAYSAAVGAGRARRRVRLCRLPHEPALRLAAGEADRARARHARRGAQARAGSRRVRHRRAGDQHPLPAGAGRQPGRRRRRHRYRLCRAQHRGAAGRSGRAHSGAREPPGVGAQDGRGEDRRARSPGRAGARQVWRGGIGGGRCGAAGRARRSAGHDAAARAAAGHHRADRGRVRAGHPRRRAGADHGIHEDGACDRGARLRPRARDQALRWATRCSRATA